MTDKSRKKSSKAAEKAETEAPTEAPEEPVKDELSLAKEEVAKYLDMARRLQAEFDNYRKRSLKEKEEFRKFATEELVKDMLSIVDDMDRALATAVEETDLVVGFRGVRKNMMKALEAKGLREIPADGAFDPTKHEAMCTVPGEEDGMIAQVYQKGYEIDGKVVRYSKVIVTKKPEEQKSE